MPYKDSETRLKRGVGENGFLEGQKMRAAISSSPQEPSLAHYL